MTEWEKYCLSKEADVQKMFPNANLKNPQTFTDKMQWLKIHDSTFLKAFCADKITLRDYCKEKLGVDLCFPIIAIYEKPEQIEWNKLPEKFVIKCNHGSEFNLIVKDKKTLNIPRVNATLNRWLSINYGDLSYELHYNLIPKKIFIEKFEENFGKSALTDYKFSCFNGDAKICQVMNDRFTNKLHFNYYDMNFNPMTNVSRNDHPANYNLKDAKPKTWDKMIEYANILSKDFKFVRVDFYEVEGKIYLGELTFIPGSGRMVYKNPNTNLEFGKLLRL